MSLSPRPGAWLLSPTLDYPPGSSISLGNILADPWAPHRPLATLPADSWPTVTTTVHNEVTIASGGAHWGSVSVGAQLLDLLGAHVGGEAGRERKRRYTMTALRTEFFAKDPLRADVREFVLGTPDAKRALLHPLRRGRLFLVAGLKIAEGLRASESVGVVRGAGVGADAPVLAAVAPGVSVGAEISGFVERSGEASVSVTGEVVLAYKLLKISVRGWRAKELVLDEYRRPPAEWQVCGAAPDETEREKIYIDLEDDFGAAEGLLEEDEDDMQDGGGGKLDVVDMEDEDGIVVYQKSTV